MCHIYFPLKKISIIKATTPHAKHQAFNDEPGNIKAKENEFPKAKEKSNC